MKKVCTKCGRSKALEEYYKDASKKDGRRPDCKSCCNARQKKYRKSDRGKAAQSKYFRSDKGKAVKARASAKYARSDKGKAPHTKAKGKYLKTDKGKAAKARENSNKKYWKSKTINNLKAEEFKCTLFLQNYQCIGGCGRYFDEVEPTRDHIYPVSKGGDLIKENVQALCQSCNSKKGIKYIDKRSEMHKEMIEKKYGVFKEYSHNSRP